MEGKAKPKVKLFAWMAMHHKISTAKNLAARGMHHNQLCSLCSASPEDMHHLLLECAFTKEVLRYIWSWFNLNGTHLKHPKTMLLRLIWVLLQQVHREEEKSLEFPYIVGGTFGRKGMLTISVCSSCQHVVAFSLKLIS
jgi:hypothetical protein